MAGPVKEKEVMFIGGHSTQCFLLGGSAKWFHLILTITLQRRSHFPHFKDKAIVNERLYKLPKASQR